MYIVQLRDCHLFGHFGVHLAKKNTAENVQGMERIKSKREKESVSLNTIRCKNASLRIGLQRKIEKSNTDE